MRKYRIGTIGQAGYPTLFKLSSIVSFVVDNNLKIKK